MPVLRILAVEGRREGAAGQVLRARLGGEDGGGLNVGRVDDDGIVVVLRRRGAWEAGEGREGMWDA